MRKYVLLCVAACFYYSGLVAFARFFIRLRGKRLVILNYHQASGGNLERHLLYLRRYYHILPLEKALEELYSQCPAVSSQHDRRPLLAITFDDGYSDNYSYAFPLAQRLRVPLTFYLIPGYVGSAGRFWWQEGRRLVASTPLQEVRYDDAHFDLRQSMGRTALFGFIDAHLRFASSVATREHFLSRIRHLLAVPVQLTSGEASSLPLTWEQIQEMDRSGWISFGAHTMNHPILSCLSEQDELDYEVQGCRTALEQRLGHSVASFAYPVGQWQHIDTRALYAVQQAGYRWALTTSYGINTPQDSPFQLKRIEADINQHWLIVAVEAAGLWGFFSRLRWHPFIRQYFTDAPSSR